MPPAEGSLEAPERHPLGWQEHAFTDVASLEGETRRVFDVCHSCRRCFNLCDSFPRLFDLIDEAPTGELDSVSSKDFAKVAEACTLCDMCFMTKCPYVPPHEFNIDFPHLMLRHRALAAKEKRGSRLARLTARQLSRTDFNAKMLRSLRLTSIAAFFTRQNWFRFLLERLFSISSRAVLPRFAPRALTRQVKTHDDAPLYPPNPNGPAKGEKAVLYATCQGEHHRPGLGKAALKVLAHLGVEVKLVYPGCCGMPRLEQGDIAGAVKQGENLARTLLPLSKAGYVILTPTASCSLMLRAEYPLLMPDNDAMQKLSAATKDLTHYLADIARDKGLGEGLKPLSGGLAVHMACHARAQNVGAKAIDLLRHIPEANFAEITRCSGHGGIFGVMRPTDEAAAKIARAPARQINKAAPAFIASDCPLAASHLASSAKMEVPPRALHPVQALALAYGFAEGSIVP